MTTVPLLHFSGKEERSSRVTVKPPGRAVQSSVFKSHNLVQSSIYKLYKTNYMGRSLNVLSKRQRKSRMSVHMATFLKLILPSHDRL